MNAVQLELEQTRRSIKDVINSATVKMLSTAESFSMCKNSEQPILKSESLKEFETLMTYTNDWISYPSCNVKGRLCAFNDPDVDMTVVNIKFGPGGFIKPHYHDRIERVFVLDGEYVDTVTNTTYKRGECQEIPSGQLHSTKSDYALLVITWQPAYN